MKYTEQDLKDEYEQAIKRKGKLYAEGYVEGLKDAHTQALTIPVVSSSFSIGFAQYIAENHYKLVNVENGKYYWKNETHLKTSQQLMKTFKDTIDFK